MVHPALLFIATAIVTGGVISTIAIWMMASSLLHPPRMTDGKALYVLRRLTPADVNLPFETLNCTVRDEHEQPLKIAGWWIPNAVANGRCVILLHGYADAKVGALAWAPTWHKLGFNLYLPDLRAHGESGGDTCTGGCFERHDIAQVIDQLRENHPNDVKQLFLFGASMGAAIALGVAAQRDDITGVVIDSPYADFASASAAHMTRLGLPGDIFQQPAVALAQWLSKADFAAAAPERLLTAIASPMMMVLPAADIFITAASRAKLARIITERISCGLRDHLWEVAEVAHLMPLVAFPTEYAERLAAFCAIANNESALISPTA